MSATPSLPIEHHRIVDIEWNGHLRIQFDDPANGLLELTGPFELLSGEERDLFAPPFPEWVRDVVATLSGVPVTLVRWRRSSRLRIVFADQRELHVPDGPYENWHFRNGTGLTITPGSAGSRGGRRSVRAASHGHARGSAA